MAVSVFGITYTGVRNHYFPSLADFGASTKPTATSVTEMIDREAARLTGALSAADVAAATISDAPATYPAAYAWCQDTIALGAAIRVMRAISGEGAVPTKWREELESRYATLRKNGAVTLGDAPAPAQLTAGPRTHISNHSLDTGDTDDISDVIPVFRRDDAL